ncbi:uncharacterized protein [Prorops nasuta]|uniref:uncharacterized protein n=1 Tax=Prorops nasuta TaxID=863751 RepID=UPI0034CFBA10
MNSSVLDKSFTVQGRDTPVPVAEGVVTQAPLLPSASDCGTLVVGQAAMRETATARSQEVDRQATLDRFVTVSGGTTITRVKAKKVKPKVKKIETLLSAAKAAKGMRPRSNSVPNIVVTEDTDEATGAGPVTPGNGMDRTASNTEVTVTAETAELLLPFKEITGDLHLARKAVNEKKQRTRELEADLSIMGEKTEMLRREVITNLKKGDPITKMTVETDDMAARLQASYVSHLEADKFLMVKIDNLIGCVERMASAQLHAIEVLSTKIDDLGMRTTTGQTVSPESMVTGTTKKRKRATATTMRDEPQLPGASLYDEICMAAAMEIEDSPTRPNGTPTSAGNISWATVVANPKPQRDPSKLQVPCLPRPSVAPNEPIAPGPVAPRVSTPRTRSRAPRTKAVKVAVNEGTKLDDVLPTIRSKVNPAVLGLSITAVRKTRAGDLLIEVGSETQEDKVDVLSREIDRALNGLGSVVQLNPTTAIDVTDIETWATEEEILQALKDASNLTSESGAVKIVSSRVTFGNLKRVRALLPDKAAEALILAGRVRIGWTMGMVKPVTTPIRCTKCHQSGHRRAMCVSVKDRSGLCMRCGNEGHKSAECRETSPRCLSRNANCSRTTETASLRVRQLNVGHGTAAQALLVEKAVSEHVDILILAEPRHVRDSPLWLSSELGGAAIICLTQDKWSNVSRSRYYVKGSMRGVDFLSVYAPPSIRLEEYRNILAEIDLAIAASSAIILAGDFNDRHLEWDRGRCSVVDLTLSRGPVGVRGWQILGEDCLSDHKPIEFEVIRTATSTSASRPPVGGGSASTRWSTASFDVQLAHLAIQWTLPRDANDHRTIEEALQVASSASMRPKMIGGKRRPKWWWNLSLKIEQSRVSALRRDMLKVKDAEERTRCRATWLAARAEFKRCIKTAKDRSWSAYIDSLNENPWGMPFRRFFRGPHIATPIRSMSVNGQIIQELFPMRDENDLRSPGVDANDLCASGIPPVTIEEVVAAIGSLRTASAPGDNGIEVMLLKALSAITANALADAITGVFTTGKFPTQWKQQRLLLIPKANKDTYRPICLLSAVSKIAEMIIKTRLEKICTAVGIPCARQFGFRKGKSTGDAIESMLNIFRQGTRVTDMVLMVAIDIANAFNSINHSAIVESLKLIAGMPKYLTRVMEDYLRGRTIVCQNVEGDSVHDCHRGVPQGSVLGPTLWNVAFDRVTRINLPPGCWLTAFADDVAIVVRGRTKTRAMQEMQRLIDDVVESLSSLGLKVAPHKCELMARTGYRDKKTNWLDVKVCIGDTPIGLVQEMKYLGVWIDRSLTFRRHFQETLSKTARSSRALRAILPRIRGPAYHLRKLYVTVIQSIMLYGAPIWHTILRRVTAKKRARSTSRVILLMATGACCSVSTDALEVLAGAVPIDLLIEERAAVWSRIRTGSSEGTPAAEVAEIKREERDNTMEKWQSRWDNATKGRWTQRIIPSLHNWISSAAVCPLDYHVTQVLTGHGSFYHHRHRMNKEASANCDCGMEIPDDAAHHLFVCPKWNLQRESLWDLATPPTPENLIDFLKSRNKWQDFRRFCRDTLTSKDESIRDRVIGQRVGGPLRVELGSAESHG